MRRTNKLIYSGFTICIILLLVVLGSCGPQKSDYSETRKSENKKLTTLESGTTKTRMKEITRSTITQETSVNSAQVKQQEKILEIQNLVSEERARGNIVYPGTVKIFSPSELINLQELSWSSSIFDGYTFSVFLFDKDELVLVPGPFFSDIQHPIEFVETPHSMIGLGSYKVSDENVWEQYKDRRFLISYPATETFGLARDVSLPAFEPRGETILTPDNLIYDITNVDLETLNFGLMTDDQTSKTEQNKLETESNADILLSDILAYQDIIDKAIEGAIDFSSHEEYYPFENNYSYSLIDVTGDGFPELIIFNELLMDVFYYKTPLIYTIENDQAKLIGDGSNLPFGLAYFSHVDDGLGLYVNVGFSRASGEGYFDKITYSQQDGFTIDESKRRNYRIDLIDDVTQDLEQIIPIELN